jgi:hypothetical protein
MSSSAEKRKSEDRAGPIVFSTIGMIILGAILNAIHDTATFNAKKKKKSPPLKITLYLSWVCLFASWISICVYFINVGRIEDSDTNDTDSIAKYTKTKNTASTFIWVFIVAALVIFCLSFLTLI